MARKKESSLPKVIQDEDHSISTILEQDMLEESRLLKQLVDDVLQANMEIKERNSERIFNTRQRLEALDQEIDALNDNIDRVDRDTVLEQLNYMIDSENIIYTNLKEIRFYEANTLPTRLTQYEDLYNAFLESVLSIKNTEQNYGQMFKDENKALFDKQKEITEDIISHFITNHTKKLGEIKDAQDGLTPLKDSIQDLENDYFNFVEDSHQQLVDLKATSTSTYNQKEPLESSLDVIYKQRREDVKQAKENLKPRFDQQRKELVASYHEQVKLIEEEIGNKNRSEVEQERVELEKKNAELQRIKRDIITAEKKRNNRQVQALMREYDQIQRSKKSKYVNQAERERESRLTSLLDKTTASLKALQIKFETDAIEEDKKLRLLDVELEEDKMLYAIKSERDALDTDITITTESMAILKSLYDKRKEMLTSIYTKRRDLRIKELNIMRQYEYQEYTDLSFYGALLNDLQQVEEKRLNTLLQNQPSFEKMKIYQNYFVEAEKIELEFYQNVHDLDRKILTRENNSIANIEKQKESIGSEIIYQESLIAVAKKENELQRIKVDALYENERNLAEEQANRIELGIKVNDKFVESTLSNQLLFAKQQIHCAESEYKIRLENIELTREQELTFANKKINYFKQQYDYEISQLEKAKEDKLEDLKYKLLLFTSKKDSNRINAQINKIEAEYDAQIDAIIEKREVDPEIKRFQSIMEDTNNRADQAMTEAETLKQETVGAFETLYTQTEQKINAMKKTKQAASTQGIVPLLNGESVSNAETRLQKAIEEADTLYDDQVKIPLQKISALNEELLRITKDDETKVFVESLKQKKTELYESFIASKAKMEQERDQLLSQLNERIQSQEYIKLDASTIAPVYRSKVDIDKDYNGLESREKVKATAELKALKKHYRTIKRKQNKDLRKSLKLAKRAVNEYNKHIRLSTRDLSKAKTDIEKNFDQTKQKKVTYITSNFNPKL